MRKTIMCTILFLIALSSFSQSTNSQPAFTQQDYLEKSKNQGRAGLIVLAAGVGLWVTSAIIPKGEVVVEGFNLGIIDTNKYKNDGVKNAFFVAGTLTVLSSIPVFISSGTNRKKAMSVSFKNENAFVMHNQTLVNTSVPAIGMKVNF